MKSVLKKRIPRELIKEWKKYIALFAIMTIVIGFVSGIFVANDSMEQAALRAYDIYNIEDGHFNLKDEATDKLIDSFEDENITVYEQFYKETPEEENTVRVFMLREKVNLPCLMKGELPDQTNEIAIDRMHASNIGVDIGDEVTIGGIQMTIVGLIALPDYSTLFEDNSDLVFNAMTFDVALVTEETFDEIDEETVYQYAFLYDEKPEDTEEQKEMADELVERLYILAATGGDENNPDFDNLNEVTGFLPEYINQAIHFAPEDFGSDKAMGEVLLIILIAVIAFIFAITESNTIMTEASVIGTLRASGYTKGELLRHYMTVPFLVTMFSAIMGNALGYSLFKNVVVWMYYNSYSLPTYQTLWNTDAFVKTTVYPVMLVIVINFLVIRYKLSFSPLQFLRRDLTRTKRKKAIRLPRWKFINRVRIRILMQNIPGYFTLLLGICFVTLLLAFAIGLPSTLKNYQDHASDYMIANYQYVLKSTVDVEGNELSTSEKSAEKYSSKGLLTVDGVHVGEEITAFGFADNSKYFDLQAKDFKDNEVCISVGYAEKFGLDSGDEIRLKEKYTSDEYVFTIAGIYNQEGIMAIFMPNKTFNRIFDYDENHYTGFLSDRELEDIDENYIYSVITVEDILKMVRQLDHSMGSFMEYFAYGCMVLAMLLILLLTKIIIENNTVSISMLKVLGYTAGEINSIFIRLTTIMVIISTLIGESISGKILTELWKVVLYDLSGWFHFYISKEGFMKIFIMVLVAYLIVVLFDMRRIKRIPMAEALKSVE